MRSEPRAVTYAVCQAVGWLGWTAISVAFIALSRYEVTAARVGNALLINAAGFAISHGYRWFVRRRRWTQRTILALVPRLLLGSVVQGALLDACFLLCVRHPGVAGDPALRYETATPVILLFNFSIVYLLWSLIYFGVHWFERSRRAERAELSYLKSQLNPHFLFNALNSVRGLVAEDPVRAQASITRLAKLLRVALASVSADTVPLDRDLEVVEDYLALEAVRLEHRLRVTLDIAPDARAAPVPAMLVQTLVENAIKHGVARRRDGGELVVAARLAGRTLIIEVTNTAAPEPGEPGHGVGLANARERLQLLFGPGATLRLDRSRAELTVAEARIPLP